MAYRVKEKDEKGIEFQVRIFQSKRVADQYRDELAKKRPTSSFRVEQKKKRKLA